ncbi:MAG: DinB family protein [Pyrinomonadaceae bacterium]
MKYETIADIYSANEKIRERLTATLSSITPDELTALPEGEKWSIQGLVEHISMVEYNVARICANLIDAAKTSGKLADGSLAISENFMKQWGTVADAKLEAPERVQPTGNVSISDTYQKMEANRTALAALRADFESYDFSGPKFPHPYFGDLTATEWLVLLGGHEARHTRQIEKLVEKIRQ